MNGSSWVTVALVLSLLFTPLGLATLMAADHAIDPFFAAVDQLWSMARCYNPSNWAIEGLISNQRVCTCLVVFPVRCGSERQPPIISMEPERSPYADVQL